MSRPAPTWRSARPPQKSSDWREGRGCDGISLTAACVTRALPCGFSRPQSSRSFDRRARHACPRQCSVLPRCSRPSAASRRRAAKEPVQFPGLRDPERRTAPRSNRPAYRRRQSPHHPVLFPNHISDRSMRGMKPVTARTRPHTVGSNVDDPPGSPTRRGGDANMVLQSTAIGSSSIIRRPRPSAGCSPWAPPASAPACGRRGLGKTPSRGRDHPFSQSDAAAR
jgi:hypothetical protein